jgi:hypothetical protein
MRQCRRALNITLATSRLHSPPPITSFHSAARYATRVRFSHGSFHCFAVRAAACAGSSKSGAFIHGHCHALHAVIIIDYHAYAKIPRSLRCAAVVRSSTASQQR